MKEFEVPINVMKSLKTVLNIQCIRRFPGVWEKSDKDGNVPKLAPRYHMYLSVPLVPIYYFNFQEHSPPLHTSTRPRHTHQIWKETTDIGRHYWQEIRVHVIPLLHSQIPQEKRGNFNFLFLNSTKNSQWVPVDLTEGKIICQRLLFFIKTVFCTYKYNFTKLIMKYSGYTISNKISDKSGICKNRSSVSF